MSTYPKNQMEFRSINRRFNRYLVMRRFLKYVEIGKLDECWEWKGATLEFGHGQFFWLSQEIYTAHAAAYELFVGSRKGKCVLHSCDNPPCVNPGHLWLGTHQENMDDMVRKNRSSGKLTLKKAIKIRQLFSTGDYSLKRLARKYGVSVSTINETLSHRRWTASPSK